MSSEFGPAFTLEEAIEHSGSSFLEQKFAKDLWERGWRAWPLPTDLTRAVWFEMTAGCSGVAIAQHKLTADAQTFQVDFVFLGKRTVVVELDGHEFHERNPEQASRDRSRDRTLQLANYIVLRFTYSELTRYVDSCFRDIRLAMEMR